MPLPRTGLHKLISPIIIVLLLSACSRLGTAENPTVTPLSTRLPTATRQPTVTPTPTQAVMNGTVTIWHAWDEAVLPGLVQMIASFQERYPEVSFDVLYIPLEDLRLRFEQAAGEGGGPSVLLGPAAWGPPLYDAGLLSDVNSLGEGNTLERLNQAALAGGQHTGVQVGLPYAIQGVVLYRNQGLILETPVNFEDLVSLAKGITQGETIGADLERGFFYSGAHLNGIGGQLMGPDGLPAFNDLKGQEWVELLRQFEQAGPTEQNSDRDLEFFEAGKVGFIIDGTWNRTALEEAVGVDNLAIDPWPAYGDGFLSGFVQADNLYLAQYTSGADREASQKFIEYFLSSGAQETLARAGLIPALTGVQVSDALVLQAMEALAGGTAYPNLPQIDFYAAPLDAALKAALSEGQPPAEALQAADQAIRDAVQGAGSTPTP